MTSVDCDRFQELKMRISLIRRILDDPARESANIEEEQAIVQKFTLEPLENLADKSFGRQIVDLISSSFSRNRTGAKKPSLAETSDLDFIRGLDSLVGAHPALIDLGQEVFQSLRAYLLRQEDRFVEAKLAGTVSRIRNSREQEKEADLNATYNSTKNDLRRKLWEGVREAMQSGPS